MDLALPSGETIPAHDFFTRARARLTLEVPAALNDHAAEAKRGDLDLDPGEVADAFAVPLALLMEPANHQRKSRDWQGIERKYYAMPFGERYIWVVTSAILRNLYERIYQPA